jgi:hypothetical protein
MTTIEVQHKQVFAAIISKAEYWSGPVDRLYAPVDQRTDGAIRPRH